MAQVFAQDLQLLTTGAHVADDSQFIYELGLMPGHVKKNIERHTGHTIVS